MVEIHRRASGRRRRFVGIVAVGLAVLGFAFTSFETTPAKAQSKSTEASEAAIYATTYDYVANFYPLWFTYYQWLYSPDNRFGGPKKVTPLYQIVVAINVDTIYASTVLSLESDPVVINLPSTKTTYSILSLDPFGNILDIDTQTEKGAYVFTGPDYVGSLPSGLTEVKVPLNTSFLIIRADKYSSSGKYLTKAAEKFRKKLTSQTLTDYNNGVDPESALVLPEIAFALPFKTAADFLAKYTGVEFLKMLQNAVAGTDYNYSTYEQGVSDAFDALFGDGSSLTTAEKIAFELGVKSAHKAIKKRYLDTRGSTNWTHFTNIGDWGDEVIDRAAITEYCQYCNGISTAAYYHGFYDKDGKKLKGTRRGVYVLRFPKNKIPDVSRFWSLTAYTPDSVELVENTENKYVVASYTSGLTYNGDGSLTLYLATTQPSGVPKANWLPIPSGKFNVMLRLYGPNDASDYLPPAIRKR